MNTILAYTFGVITTLIGVTYLVPTQTNVTMTPAITETVYINDIVTTIDLEQLRNTTDLDPNLDAALAAECTYAIQRQTDEPLQGIVIHVERWWQGDACAAYAHQAEHGWY
jgi:hypothetical protein